MWAAVVGTRRLQLPLARWESGLGWGRAASRLIKGGRLIKGDSLQLAGLGVGRHGRPGHVASRHHRGDARFGITAGMLGYGATRRMLSFGTTTGMLGSGIPAGMLGLGSPKGRSLLGPPRGC